MSNFFKNILLATIGVMSAVALFAIGLTAIFILLGIMLVMWVYIILVRKGIIKRPNMGKQQQQRSYESDVVDAEYEVVEETNSLPKD